MTRLSRQANYSFIRTDILIEHLEEADFLFGLRNRAVSSPDFDMRALAKLERRLDAHLDGLALGGERTLYALAPELAAEDPWRVTAMAGGLLTMGRDGPQQQVFDLVPAEGGFPSPAIAAALKYLPLEAGVEKRLQRWLDSPEPGPLALAWDVLGFHRVMPAADPVPASKHDDPAVRAAVVTAVGRLHHPDHKEVLVGLRQDTDPQVRRRAAEARAQVGDPDLLADLREARSSAEGMSGWEVALLASLGDPADVEFLTGMLTDEALAAPLAETVMAGLATLGRLEAVPALLAAMERADLAAAAGQAFVRITGLDLPVLPEVEPSPEQEDASFEDLRPQPDPGLCRDLWTEKGNDWPPAKRWRHGLELDSQGWIAQPDDGDLLTRREEITRLCYNQPLAWSTLELDAPVARQRAWTLKET